MPAALWGDFEGFRVERNPSKKLPARTAAFDGRHASTRAARSASIRFAVILLSKAMDVGQDHLIHRKRSPFPYEGKDLTPGKVGENANVWCECWARNILDSRLTNAHYNIIM